MVGERPSQTLNDSGCASLRRPRSRSGMLHALISSHPSITLDSRRVFSDTSSFLSLLHDHSTRLTREMLSKLCILTRRAFSISLALPSRLPRPR